MGAATSEIHRYTDLPGLLAMLQQRKLTLLDPKSWDDTNDSYFLSLYKKAKKLTCLTALCFSEAEETYHHWSVFAGGSSGIRITFARTRLFVVTGAVPEIRGQKVDYKLIADLKLVPRDFSDLPFLKRHPYHNENEFRMIYESTEAKQGPISIDLPLGTIRQITLSPWMNKAVSQSVKETIKSIRGCENMRVHRSTLIGNDDWMAYGDAAYEAYIKAARTE
jgi:hypothetical protein